MVVVDTNLIIDHLRQRGTRLTHLMGLTKAVGRDQLALSVITLQELYEGQSTKDPAKEDALLVTITPLRLFPYTPEIAQLAGELARDLSRPIEFADAAIAATTISYSARLATLNKKDFIDIPGLELWKG